MTPARSAAEPLPARRSTCPEGCPGHEPGRCRAHSKRSGRPCRAHPMQGTVVCNKHGGMAPQVRKAAARRVALGKATAELALLGVPIEVDPLETLVAQVWEAAGNVAVLRIRVQGLLELYGPDHLGDAVPHVLVQMYDAERDRLARMARHAIEAGVSERAVRLAERQGELIVQVIVRVLGAEELALDDGRREAGLRLASAELRALGTPRDAAGEI